MRLEAIEQAIFSLDGEENAFLALAERIVLYQQEANPIYSRYCNELDGVFPAYLPIAAFKHGAVCTFPPKEAEQVFLSSGTGRGIQSRHYIRHLHLYEASFKAHFKQLFGHEPLTLVAHLPHYTAMGQSSSLLYMVEGLIEAFGNEASGMFLEDSTRLRTAIKHAQETGSRLVLFGAAFGLLDLAEANSWVLPARSVVIETGGMKTYRREITREVLHRQLADGFHIDRAHIWSEYGMCELLSQAYTRGGSVFFPPPWMRFEIMDIENPLQPAREGEAGILAVLDLANLHSVSAILTEDRAIQRGDGVEILGRLSGAELRGCNFLLESTG